MTIDINVSEVEALMLAGVSMKTSFSELSNIIPALLTEVYNFLKSRSIKNHGPNLVLYLDNAPTIIAGVEVYERFADTDHVLCSTVPGGKVARTLYAGPYHHLPGIHRAICEWCESHHLEPAGPNWEIYGDWNDDPLKLETEVCYLLKA